MKKLVASNGGRTKRSKKTKKKGPWKGFVYLTFFVIVMGVMFKLVLPLLQPTISPETSPVDRATLQRAEGTPGGQLLKKSGYDAKSVISDDGIVKFLDEQEKHSGVTGAGPYVVFQLPNRPVVQYGDPKVAPDQVVDIKNGVIVALMQDFKAPGESSGRGAICYVTRTVADLANGWTVLNVQNGYLRGKSLPMLVPVTRNDVPALPKMFPDTNCYVYPS